MAVTSKKQEYLNELKVNNLTKYDELKKAYVIEVFKLIKNKSNQGDIFLNLMKLNEAFSNLSINCMENELSSIATVALCHKAGMSYEVAKNTYMKFIKVSQNISFENWLNNRITMHSKINREKIVKKIMLQPVLALIPCEEIISIYETDYELKYKDIDIDKWLDAIIYLCTELMSYNINNNLTFNLKLFYGEYSKFLSNYDEDSFINHLMNQISIEKLCKEIGITKFIAEHAYNYQEEKNNLSFREYLSNILLLKNILSKLSISEREFNDYYKLSTTRYGNLNRYEFAIELFSSMTYCKDINEYFNLKKIYLELIDDSKPESFIEWLNIREYLNKNNISSLRLLSMIYHNQVNSKNLKTMEEVFDDLSGMNVKKKKM